MSTIEKTLFIQQEQLTQNSVLNENIDWKVIKVLLWDVQQMRILPILGTNLYNKIADGIANNNLVGDYLGLLNNYIIDTITAYVVADSPDYLNYKFTNKNIAQKNSDNSSSLSEDQMIGIMERWSNKAQWYAQRMTMYLSSNQQLFPEYTNNNTMDAVIPNMNNYTNGMYLDDNGFADRLNFPRYGTPAQRRWY